MPPDRPRSCRCCGGDDDVACPRCAGAYWVDAEGNLVDPDTEMVDLGGGMVVPLRELLED